MPYKNPEVRREKAKEYNRSWRLRNPGWQKKMPSYGKLYGRRPTDEAAAAHSAVYRAIKCGVIIRPTECAECKMTKPVEAAHHNYSKKLDIKWLCRSCHRIYDAAHPKNGLTTLPRKRAGKPKQTKEERNAYRAAWARQDRLNKKRNI